VTGADLEERSMSESAMKIVKAMAAMAWSDGRMDAKEKEKIRLLAKRVGLDAGERSKVEGFLMSRPSLEGLTFEELNEKERQAFFLLAVHYAYMDGTAAPGEVKVLDRLAEALMITNEARTAIETQVKAAKKK
jgi:uncharacterized membrane protein YebE (DUF533 family)